MPEADFRTWWTIGALVAGSVVLIVAALLTAILLVARNIERLAGIALRVVGEIADDTRPIWSIADANAIVEDIVDTARSIEARIESLADAQSSEIKTEPEGGI